MSGADTPHVCRAATELKTRFGLLPADTLPILRKLAQREHDIAERIALTRYAKAGRPVLDQQTCEPITDCAPAPSPRR
jgi:hypothetical protein